MSTKRKYLVIPPELVDDSHSTIIDLEHANAGQALLHTFQPFLESASPGETVSIGIVEMTDEEVAAMPEI